MIIYATKQTMERYDLPDDLHPENNVISLFAGLNAGNPLQEWGAKLFYFKRHKCLQICNFASKFTIFMCNLSKKDTDLIGELMGFYLYELYCDDEEMLPAVLNLVGMKPAVFFSKLTDQRMIGTLNSTQRVLEAKNYFDRFYEDGVMDTIELNRQFNFNYVLTYEIDGRKEYLMPNERFRKLVLAAYRGE